MKVWIDISNSPHVMFFRSLIGQIEPEEILVTARDFGPIFQLLKAHQMPFKRIGKHGGRSNRGKLIASAQRTEKLAKVVDRWQPDVCVHKYSVEGARVAIGLGIPYIAVADNELAGAQNLLTLPFADTVVVPKAVGKSMRPLVNGRQVTFDGVCEVAHAKGFRPDRTLLEKLRLDTSKPIAVLRPHPYEAAYSRNNADFLNDVIDKLNRQNAEPQIVVLPRTSRDKRYAEVKNVRVPAPVDSLSLIAQADLVISGGGTMNREAAILGTPNICCFPEGLMDVNKYLIKKGLMAYATPDALVDEVDLSIEKVSGRKRAKGMENPIPLIKSELRKLVK